jgi:anti-anti-sigma factor
MDVSLKIVREDIKGNQSVTALHLTGWLDAQSEALLLAAAEEAYNDGARYLLIDLEKVDTLTSAGMRAMQKVYKIYTPPTEHFKVSRVKLCNAPPQVYHVLGITGFLQNIPNYESRESAIKSFGE